MIKRIFIVAMVSTMAVGMAMAGLSTPPEPVGSVVPELSEIVVLCAQEEKKKFEKEWGKYVKHHDLKGNDLQKAIKDVSDQASAHRDKEWKGSKASMNKMAAGKREAKEAQWKAERQKIMNEVARQIFEPSAR